MGWVVNATPRPLYPRERPGIHCIGGWVGPRAGLDGCEKSRPHRDSIPGTSSTVAIASHKRSEATELFWMGTAFHEINPKELIQ
jgi:hypothetical protein